MPDRVKFSRQTIREFTDDQNADLRKVLNAIEYWSRRQFDFAALYMTEGSSKTLSPGGAGQFNTYVTCLLELEVGQLAVAWFTAELHASAGHQLIARVRILPTNLNHPSTAKNDPDSGNGGTYSVSNIAPVICSRPGTWTFQLQAANMSAANAGTIGIASSMFVGVFK